MDVEIQKYYKCKYQFFNRQYKSNKLTKKEFTEIIERLKLIKSESETLKEFETKFNEYKKTLTIYPHIMLAINKSI